MVNFGVSLKRHGVWSIFGLPLTQRVKILQQQKGLPHHTSRITHHTAHIAYEFEVLEEIRDNNGGALGQFIKTNPQQNY